MANTKVTKAVLADDAVGLAQLHISNDPSNGQALTAASDGAGGYNLTWANNTVSGISSSADATAITIDSSERVLIGQDSGDAFNDDSILRIQRTGDRVFQQFKCDADQNVQILFGDVDDDVECTIQYHPSDKDLRFSTGNNAEAMRIDGSQNILIGATNTNSTEEGMRIFPAGSSGGMMCAIFNDDAGTALLIGRGGSNGEVQAIYRGSSKVGSITVTTSATSFNTSSDYRLKENVVTDWDATTRLKQLKPSRFNFIADADTTVDGFLAHEVSDIVPEAITGEKDATEVIGNVLNSDGDVIKENVSESEANLDTDAGETWQETGTRPIYQSIDQSKLVPLLVKTIQELEARIETLENA